MEKPIKNKLNNHLKFVILLDEQIGKLLAYLGFWKNTFLHTQKL